MCGQCAVRRSEAFLTDSPGVDGGAFDIDYGDEDNVVEDSYGHDTQGYCVAVFGAGGITANSTVRRNVCAENGRSPRLAAPQGAVFLSTWNGGHLKGVQVSENLIFWHPPVRAAAIVNNAEFEGVTLENNTIETDREEFRRNPEISERRHPMPVLTLRDAQGRPVSLDAHRGAWRLYGVVPRSGDQVAIAASAYRQFHAAGLEAVLIAPAGDGEEMRNLHWDWNLGDIAVLFDDGAACGALEVSVRPELMLVNPAGQVVWRHDGPVSPGDLGLALRAHLGDPDYAKLISEP
jgi:hypothetical protein